MTLRCIGRSPSCAWSIALILVTGAGGCGAPLFAPRLCGGRENVPCGIGRYCRLQVGACVLSGAVGTCGDVPEACAAVVDPVCGCDGKNYGSECEAAQAGVNVAFFGSCGDASNRCGGTGGPVCSRGQFCKFDFGVCGAAEAPGVCAPTPDGCSTEFEPVCGCNGLSYVNECSAYAEGVNVAHSGTCQ